MIRAGFAIILTGLVFWAATTTRGAESTIAWDGFESGDGSGGAGWNDKWVFDGNAIVYNGGFPYTGTYHLMLQNSNSIASRAVDMTIVTNAHLRFWWKARSFETGKTAAVEIYDGSWHTVLNVSDSEDDYTYHFADINLSGYNMVNNFQIRATSQLSISDYFYIDDISIVGILPQHIISGTITCGNLEVNDVNLIGLGVVTDANGFYSASVDYGWSGAVTPAKYGYAFDPNSIIYVSVTGDLTAQDYNALPADDFNDNRRGSMWRRSH